MANELKYFSIERQGDVTIITPTVADFLGETTNFEAKRELSLSTQGELPEKVVVDCHNVQRISTDFISLFLAFKRRVPPGRFAICCLQPVCREIFQRLHDISGKSLFEIFDDVTQAVESFVKGNE